MNNGETRQRVRAALRTVSKAVLKRLLPTVPRRTIRIGSRAYANQAWRDQEGHKTPARHRYRRVRLNASVRDWMKAAGK